MKTRIVRFDNQDIYHNLSCLDGFVPLSVFATDRKNLSSGKVIFSLKYGKRRRLVKGLIYIETEYNKQEERIDRHYFRPNNKLKFLSVLRTSEQSK